MQYNRKKCNTIQCCMWELTTDIDLIMSSSQYPIKKHLSRRHMQATDLPEQITINNIF